MTSLEPRPPRKQTIDYHICALPSDVLAIVRVSWYRNGRADAVNEIIFMEDGDRAYREFERTINSSVYAGANISIRSGYQPQDLGLME